MAAALQSRREMNLPKIILVPTDFSVAAETALDHALALAARLGGKVYVMHAYQLPVVGFPDGVLVPTAEIASRIVTWAQSELAACVAKRKESSVEIIPMLKQADPRDAVVSAAEEISADLVIMGTHGRRGIARALIGSVAETVVRTSPVPVMTVHAAA
jgi:nucleotide-binding universal stress UspA family protein